MCDEIQSEQSKEIKIMSGLFTIKHGIQRLVEKSNHSWGSLFELQGPTELRRGRLIPDAPIF